MKAETNDEAAAQNLRDVIRGFLALAKMQASSKPALQAMVDSLQLTGDGKTVSLAFSVPSDVLDVIEGMAKGDELHPLQKKFIELGALQCGICTPGFLVASKALLDFNPHPSEHEIRYWLAGNLCRCTGYDKIIRAVQHAAERA